MLEQLNVRELTDSEITSVSGAGTSTATAKAINTGSQVDWEADVTFDL